MIFSPTIYYTWITQELLLKLLRRGPGVKIIQYGLKYILHINQILLHCR